MKSTAPVLIGWLFALPALAQPVGPGYGLSFEGTSAYVAIATTGSLTGTFTVELWANPNTNIPAIYLGLVSSRSPVDYGFDFKFQMGTKIHGDIGNGSNWITTSADADFPYSSGIWTHIAYVVTPAIYNIYADGSLVGSGQVAEGDAVLYDSNHQLMFGTSSVFYSEYMVGQIDEVRIWSTARSASEIQTNMHLTLTGSEPGLMGYWRFDEGSGTTTADASGHGFTGTLVNGPAWVVSTAPLGPPTPPTLAIAPDGSGGYFIDVHGAPGLMYSLQRAHSPTGPWSTSTPQTAPASGLLEFHDWFVPPDRAFYRTLQQ